MDIFDLNFEFGFGVFAFGIVIFLIVLIVLGNSQNRRRIETIAELNAKRKPYTSLPEFSKARQLIEMTRQKAEPLMETQGLFAKVFGFALFIVIMSIVVLVVINPDELGVWFSNLFASLEDTVRYELLVRELPSDLDALVVGIIFVGIFVIPFIVVYGIQWLIFLFRMLTWRRVTGVISETEIDTYVIGSGKNRQRVYRTRWTVAYEAEDGTYHWGVRDIKGWRQAQNAMSEAQAGSFVTVWHHPSQPQRHVVRGLVRDDLSLA